MASNGFVYAATQANFPQLVLENSRRGLVLVDFWSAKAGPSLRQREMLLRLADQMGGRFLLVTVNTDQERKLAREYGVHSLPSFKLFRHGRVVEEVRGVQPEADYRAVVERHLAVAMDSVQRAAMQAWQAGERERAVQILAEGAVADPDNPALPLLMAKLLMQQGRHDDAHEVLRAVPAPAADDPQIVRLLIHLDFILTATGAPPVVELEQSLAREPDDQSIRYRLAASYLLQDDYPRSLGLLMDIVRQAPDFRDGVARKGLLVVQETLGDGDERVRKVRAELFNLAH